MSRPRITPSFDLTYERDRLRVFRYSSNTRVEMLAGSITPDTWTQLDYLAGDTEGGWHTRRSICAAFDLEVDQGWLRVIETLPDGRASHLLTGRITEDTAPALVALAFDIMVALRPAE